LLLQGTWRATLKVNSPSAGQEISSVLRNHDFFTAFPGTSPGILSYLRWTDFSPS